MIYFLNWTSHYNFIWKFLSFLFFVTKTRCHPNIRRTGVAYMILLQCYSEYIYVSFWSFMQNSFLFLFFFRPRWSFFWTENFLESSCKGLALNDPSWGDFPFSIWLQNAGSALANSRYLSGGWSQRSQGGQFGASWSVVKLFTGFCFFLLK